MLDEEKLIKICRKLPIAELICITPESHTAEAVRIAWNIVVERQTEVISFFRKMDSWELLSNFVVPDFIKYNPAAFTGIKQVMAERKEEMLRQLRYMDEFFEVQREMTREMEESLSRNIEYPSKRQRYEVTLASLREKKGWFVDRIKAHIKRALEKSATKPPKKLDKDTREFLEKEVQVYKRRIVYWIEEIRPMVMELLDEAGSAPESGT